MKSGAIFLGFIVICSALYCAATHQYAAPGPRQNYTPFVATEPPPKIAPAAPALDASLPAEAPEPTTERTFSSPAPTDPPVTPPMVAEVPPDDAPLTADEFNRQQRDKGLVLWKGEWMTPDERRKRRELDEYATAKPTAHSKLPAPREVEPQYSDNGLDLGGLQGEARVSRSLGAPYKDQHVSGYTRKDGTYVQPYMRRSPR